VEDDLRDCLGRTFMAAGRTDKGVSALSQVISFYVNKDHLLDEKTLLEQIQSHPAIQSGRLAVFDCQTVPRKFHALFSATWRRYMYLYPLNDPQRAQQMLDMRMKKTREEKKNTEEEEEENEGENKHNDRYPLEEVLYYPITGPRYGEFRLSDDELAQGTIDIDIPYLNELLAT
jgi:tRNA U38,U39,U40 pseudouridine synthase TruA